jgi:hypothetical protein
VVKPEDGEAFLELREVLQCCATRLALGGAGSNELYGNLAGIMEGEQLAEAPRYRLHAGLQVDDAVVIQRELQHTRILPNNTSVLDSESVVNAIVSVRAQLSGDGPTTSLGRRSAVYKFAEGRTLSSAVLAAQLAARADSFTDHDSCEHVLSVSWANSASFSKEAVVVPCISPNLAMASALSALLL